MPKQPYTTLPFFKVYVLVRVLFSVLRQSVSCCTVFLPFCVTSD